MFTPGIEHFLHTEWEVKQHPNRIVQPWNQCCFQRLEHLFLWRNALWILRKNLELFELRDEKLGHLDLMRSTFLALKWQYPQPSTWNETSSSGMYINTLTSETHWWFAASEDQKDSMQGPLESRCWMMYSLKYENQFTYDAAFNAHL